MAKESIEGKKRTTLYIYDDILKEAKKICLDKDMSLTVLI